MEKRLLPPFGDANIPDTQGSYDLEVRWVVLVSPFLNLVSSPSTPRHEPGPSDHINVRTLRSGCKAQYDGDSRNNGL